MNKVTMRSLSFLSLPFLLLSGAVYGENAPSSAPTDPQIVKILETVNNSEIGVSRVAENSNNKKIKKFAESMVAAHSASNAAADKLASQLKLTFEDSATSDQIKKDGDQTADDLKKLKGSEFDQKYVGDLVSAHESALKSLDQTLIPSAQDPQLKKMLTDTRAVVMAHLEHAKKLQSSLTK